METIKRIENIIREFFDDENIELTPETKACDIEGWDSLANVQIMISIEEEFNVHFELDDFERMKDVGAIVTIVDAKKGF